MTTPDISPHVAHVAERVREARARGTPLRIVAGGHWLDAGAPCTADSSLDLSALTGVVSYEPGDLTLTARAATSLAEIERVTASKGQWLTMDPCGHAEGSIGATIATASAGPLSSAYGTPRDHVLGCEFVTGTGDVVRAGGRVVKNVAGFDLVRLVTGSWGTLGALTEMTVRLRARPEVDRTLFVCVSGATLEAVATAAWRWTRNTDYRPLAAELLSPSLSRAIGGESEAQLLVRLGGNAAFVRAAADSVAVLGDVREGAATDAWQHLRVAEPPAAMVFRVSVLPARCGSLFAALAELAESHGGFAHATVARGIVRCVIPATSGDLALKELRALSTLDAAATLAGERMPAGFWSNVSGQPDSHALAERVRKSFDPDRVMNPGVLGAS